jgi:hypothetical protein
LAQCNRKRDLRSPTETGARPGSAAPPSGESGGNVGSALDGFCLTDLATKDCRYETLNLALYKYLPASKQCFMAGPRIKRIDLGKKYTGNFRFIRPDYKTVTVNVIDRSTSIEKFDVFLEYLKGV